MATVFLTVTPRWRAIGRYADKFRRGQARRTAGGRRTIRVRFPRDGRAETTLQRCPIFVEQNKSHITSLFGERSPYPRYHRAPPAVIGD